jgi:hypothetical protein
MPRIAQNSMPNNAQSDKFSLANYVAELLAPFLAYPRASSHNAMLARQDMPIAGKILLSATPWSHPNDG